MRMRAWSLFVFFAAAAAHGAQTYRWVDERGVTNYGEAPPAGRPAQPVNVQPAGTVESRLPGTSGVQAPPAPSAAPAPTLPREAPLPASAAAPRGMAFETYIRLQVGMTEGEVLMRAGPPDQETIDDTRVIAKSLYYYPTSANPFLTVVSIRGGRVAALERNRKTD
ncbi:MAG: DUF4124 domain-containing protein [Rhodospirillaceae bacterium]